jgi:hypothetical protein
MSARNPTMLKPSLCPGAGLRFSHSQIPSVFSTDYPIAFEQTTTARGGGPMETIHSKVVMVLGAQSIDLFSCLFSNSQPEGGRYVRSGC